MSASITLVDPPSPEEAGYKYERCDRCGEYHLMTQPCPRRQLWEPLRRGDPVPGVPVRVEPYQARHERLRPSWAERASVGCATLVVRAGAAFQRLRENRTEKKETGAMSELLIKNVKGHTGRHTAPKIPLRLRVRSRANAGVMAMAAMAAVLISQ